MMLASWKVRAVLAAAVVTWLGLACPVKAQLGLNPISGTNPPPPPARILSITSLSALQVPGRKFRISGQVTGMRPDSSCGVSITGAATGVAMCNSSGNFDATFDVPTPGPIQAIAGDGQNQSAPVGASLVNNAPTVTVQAVQGTGNAWTFSGTVGDECPAGLVVSLSGPPGVNGATATVLDGGAWSVTVTLGPNAAGMVTATVTDWYSLTGSGQTYFMMP